jgi:hypothetical protein
MRTAFNGDFIREWTVFDLVRQRFGIDVLRVGDYELARLVMPELLRL